MDQTSISVFSMSMTDNVTRLALDACKALDEWDKSMDDEDDVAAMLAYAKAIYFARAALAAQAERVG